MQKCKFVKYIAKTNIGEMKNHYPHDKRKPNDDDIPFDEPFSVASATECTGLMPFAPGDTSEIDSYEDIYDIPLSPIVANEDERNTFYRR